MKKYFMLAMIVVFAATGASARSSRAARSGNGSNGGRSVHALGFAVPLQWQTWENDDEAMDLSAAGFGIMYHHLDIRPSRFSTFMDVQMGYSSFTIDAIDGHEKNDVGTSWQDLFGSLGGFNTHYVFGIGGAPVVADRFTLAVHGTFGVHLSVALGSTDGWNDVGFESSSFSVDSGLFGFWTTIGANVDAAWRITNRVGVFAGIDMYINLFGGGMFWFDTPYYNFSDAYLINPGDFNVSFRVGVAFVY